MISYYPYKNGMCTPNCRPVPPAFPPQHQNVQPGIESIMVPAPVFEDPNYKGSGKLQNKVAVITGGDSGIGRATAVAFAKEGADIVVVYLRKYEEDDARKTQSRIKQLGRKCVLFQGDVRCIDYCKFVAQKTFSIFNRIDILVNNAGVHYVQNSIEDISAKQLEATFQTNIISYFYLTQAVLPYMKKGSAIINTASVTATEPYTLSIDYSSTKGAVVAFTRSLAKSLISRCIRVNSVSPGMTWTPIIPSSVSAHDVEYFGRSRPLGRAAQPYEIAPTYVFLASNTDSSYITGQEIVVT